VSSGKAKSKMKEPSKVIISTYDVVRLAYEVNMTLPTIPRMVSTGTYVCLECFLICKHPIARGAICGAFFSSAAHSGTGTLAAVHRRASSGVG
jgi:hypothetical protein